MSPELLAPDWPAPDTIVALSTTRVGGVSRAPYQQFNLGQHVGDSVEAVDTNRRLLLKAADGLASMAWLDQVHGRDVVEARAHEGDPATADAHWSREAGLGCAILTADCLPVLFCSLEGDVVAAAHAGWRGLQAGVLEATVARMLVPADQVLAWLGPAIGPKAFEVGADVVDRFLAACTTASQRHEVAGCFIKSDTSSGKFYGDLLALARLRLATAGVTRCYSGATGSQGSSRNDNVDQHQNVDSHCTYSNPERFFSYRREGVTGRMASVIGIRAF